MDIPEHPSFLEAVVYPDLRKKGIKNNDTRSLGLTEETLAKISKNDLT
jgi:hypothetical protein